MTPPARDLFVPEPGEAFSKSQVNKAGRRMREHYFRAPHEDLESDDERSEYFSRAVKAMVAVTWWRSEHAKPLSRASAGLRYHVVAEEALVDGRADVSQRLKRVPTMIDKLEREPTMKLANMYDIGGARARLPSLKSITDVARRLRKNDWKIETYKDYIEEPKDSGYRALHLIVRKDGRLVELQLRTVRQHAWANTVERDSRVGASGYKFGQGDEEVHIYYRLIAEAFARLDRGEELSPGLRRDINRIHKRVQAKLDPEPQRGANS